jgi:endo-1,4-beta-xylanase
MTLVRNENTTGSLRRLHSGALGVIAVGLAALAMFACNKGDDDNGGGGSGGTSTGGTNASGGAGGSSAPGSGGVKGSGGGAGSGGSTGSGGVTGAGGDTVGTGGSAGTGGARNTGGNAGTRGSAVTGGATSRGGSSGGNTVSGGATGTGGVTGTGGATGGGGVTGRGGATGTAGSMGRGGAGGGTGTGGNTGTGGTTNVCPPGNSSTGGTKYCSNTKGNAGGSYSYELWASGSGSGCMTVYGAGAKFSATWTNVEDFLARVGLSFDQTKTPDQIGNISAEFSETKSADTGLVYIGVYGWTIEPLREYYILDDWGSVRPAGTASDGTPRTSVGTITVDGDDYDVWKKTRENKPAITGDNKTFDQYFSIRHTARQCGHISVSEHFKQWTDLGLPLGKLYEAKLLVEAQDGSGNIEFTTASFAVK